jgi:hypothetical protein
VGLAREFTSDQDVDNGGNVTLLSLLALCTAQITSEEG